MNLKTEVKETSKGHLKQHVTPCSHPQFEHHSFGYERILRNSGIPPTMTEECGALIQLSGCCFLSLNERWRACFGLAESRGGGGLNRFSAPQCTALIYFPQENQPKCDLGKASGRICQKKLKKNTTKKISTSGVQIAQESVPPNLPTQLLRNGETCNQGGNGSNGGAAPLTLSDPPFHQTMVLHQNRRGRARRASCAPIE